MSVLFDLGLRPPRCNGCTRERLKHELGNNFLQLDNTIYEIGGTPSEGQGEPTSYKGKPIKFKVWCMDFGHSDECYNWKPPQK